MSNYALYFNAISQVAGLTATSELWRIATKTNNTYNNHLCAEVVFRYYDNPSTFQLYNSSSTFAGAKGMTLFHMGTNTSSAGIAAVLRKSATGVYSLGIIYSLGTTWVDLAGSFVDLSTINGNVDTDAFYFLMEYDITNNPKVTNVYFYVVVFNQSVKSTPDFSFTTTIGSDLSPGTQWGFGSAPESIQYGTTPATNVGYVTTEGYNCYVAQNVELSFLRTWNRVGGPPIPPNTTGNVYGMFNSDTPSHSLYSLNVGFLPVPALAPGLNFQMELLSTNITTATLRNSAVTPSDPCTLGTSTSAFGTLPGFGVNSTVGFTVSQPSTIPCLLEGTMILTPDRGEVPIEELKEGDFIQTHTGATSTIRKILSSQLFANEYAAPYFIPQGTYGATRDLYLSPRHAVLVNNKTFVPAEELPSLTRMTDRRVIRYFHLQTDNYWSDTLVANGVAVETWCGRVPYVDPPLKLSADQVCAKTKHRLWDSMLLQETTAGDGLPTSTSAAQPDWYPPTQTDHLCIVCSP